MAAFNPVSGEVEPGMVSDTFVHEQVATWELTTETGSVITTAVHPFYVEGKGWVEAQDLRAGDQLRDDTGNLVAVVSIAATGDVATVYNFTVEQHHNYHVRTGTSWVLVHNGCRTGGRRGNQATRDHLDQVRDDFLKHNPDYVHVGGGRNAVTGDDIPEVYLPPMEPGARRGASYPDLTFKGPQGDRVHINTVDTYASGEMTRREARNFDRIFKQTDGETIIAIAKPK